MIVLARLGIALAVLMGDPEKLDGFPSGVAFQYPGYNYVYAHARTGAFKPLWTVQVGDEIEWEGRTWVVYAYGPILASEIGALLEQDRSDRLVLQTSMGPSRDYGEWTVRCMLKRVSWRGGFNIQ